MGLYWDNGKENGNYRDYRAFIGFCWGNIGIMEKNMETTIILGLDWGNIGIREHWCNIGIVANKMEITTV